MQSRLIILSILLFFNCLISFGQIEVTKVSDQINLAGKKGIIYSLPYTMIKVEVEVEKTRYLAGPYATFAERYLDIGGISSEDFDTYEITGVNFFPFQIADPSEVYFVQITDALSKEEKSLEIALSELGIVRGKKEYGTKGKQTSRTVTDKMVDSDEFFSYSAETNLYEYFDTIIQRVQVDTVMVETMYVDSKWIEKTDETKALEAANKISRIRDARFNLLSGYQEIPYPAGTIEYMDKELEKMENEYLSLFTGIKQKQKLYYSFNVSPRVGDDIGQVAVFNFSEQTGVKDLSSSGGERIYIRFTKPVDDAALKAKIAEHSASGSSNNGFYYRIPASYEVSMEINNNLKKTKMLPISQAGAIGILPPNVSSLQIYKETGALENVKFE